MQRIPNEIIHRILCFVSLKELRKVVNALGIEDTIIVHVIKHHVLRLGITFPLFSEDTFYVIRQFFDQFTRPKGTIPNLYIELVTYINKSFVSNTKKQIFTQIVDSMFKKRPFINLNYIRFFIHSDELMTRLYLSGNIHLEKVYLLFIREMSSNVITNKRIVKQLLSYQISDLIPLNDYYWIQYTKTTSITNPSDEQIDIFRTVLHNHLYLNDNMIRVLFNNTIFPKHIIQFWRTSMCLRNHSLIEFLIWNRLYGNFFQIYNYQTIKNCFQQYNKIMYLHLLREERKLIKRIVRIKNPYSSKVMKPYSRTYNNVLKRLEQDGYLGTIIDIQLDAKHEIDAYHKSIFGTIAFTSQN